jgi:hypothetical protein
MTNEERAFNEYFDRYSSLCFAIGLIRSEYSKEEKITRLRQEEPELFKFLFPTETHVKAFMKIADFGDEE